jgi:hypothetical protein
MQRERDVSTPLDMRNRRLALRGASYLGPRVPADDQMISPGAIGEAVLHSRQRLGITHCSVVLEAQGEIPSK